MQRNVSADGSGQVGVTIPGSDVFSTLFKGAGADPGVLKNIAAALRSGDTSAMNTALGDLDQASETMQSAHSLVGEMLPPAAGSRARARPGWTRSPPTWPRPRASTCPRPSSTCRSSRRPTRPRSAPPRRSSSPPWSTSCADRCSAADGAGSRDARTARAIRRLVRRVVRRRNRTRGSLRSGPAPPMRRAVRMTTHCHGLAAHHLEASRNAEGCRPSPFEQSRKPPMPEPVGDATMSALHYARSTACRCASAPSQTTSRTSRPPATTPRRSPSRTRCPRRSSTAAAPGAGGHTARSLEPTRMDGNNVNLDEETVAERRTPTCATSWRRRPCRTSSLRMRTAIRGQV